MSITTPKPTEKPVEVPQVDPLEEVPVLPEEPNVSETVVILRKARDYIAQPRKWVKNTEYRHGAVCLLGAINHAAVPDYYPLRGPYLYYQLVDKSSPALELLAAAINPDWPGDEDVSDACDVVTEYNDQPGRQKRDVIRKLNKAINLGLKESK